MQTQVPEPSALKIPKFCSIDAAYKQDVSVQKSSKI